MSAVSGASAAKTSFPATIANYYKGSKVQQAVNATLSLLGSVLATLVKYKLATAFVAVVVVGVIAYRNSPAFKAAVDKIFTCSAAAKPAGGAAGADAPPAGVDAKDQKKDVKAGDPK